jgi:hypothetical protein
MWDTRRKIIYALAAGISLSVIAVLVAYSFKDAIFPQPTCFDKKQNGFELGVDCGGTCSLMCSQEIKPLTSTWAKAIPVRGDLYDLAAMIINTNINNASSKTSYTFTVYGANGNVIGTFSDSVVAPIDSIFPVIIQNVLLKEPPRNVILEITDDTHVRVPEHSAVSLIQVKNKRFENGSISRVYATIVNTRRIEIRDLPVKVVLFDVNNNAYAVGQTVIPFLDKEGVREIIVTWGGQFSAQPDSIGVYPIIDPFLPISN